MKIFLRIVAGIVLLVVVAALGVYVWGQPIYHMGGRQLRGTVVTQPVTDWSFVNTLGVCQIEVRPDSPRSVNVGCYGKQNDLFVSHNLIPNAGKSWAEFLADNPNARIRFDGNLYPVMATPITDRAERQKVMDDRRAALGRTGGGGPVKDNVLIFKLESR